MSANGDASASAREPRDSDAYVVAGTLGAPVGMAIYLGDGVLLTCAHVVADALGDRNIGSRKHAPDALISIRFFRTTNVILEARVRPDGWYPVVTNDEAQRSSERGAVSDIAVIDLVKGSCGVEAQAAIFTDVEPSRWPGCLRFYGNTKSRPIGGWVSARENGAVEKDRVELLMEDGEDNIVESGCSGSLVWDVLHGRCVGMIDSRRTNKVAFMIPFDCLSVACPDLRQDKPEGDRRYSQIRRAVILIDRTDERLAMHESLPKITTQAPPTPAICLISGNFASRPDLLVDAFVQWSFRQILSRDQRYLQSVRIQFVPDGGSASLMRTSIAKLICLDPAADAAKIAEQLRARKEGLLLLTDLFVEVLDDQALATLRDYVSFLKEISRARPNVLFFQFFIITTDNDELMPDDCRRVVAAIEETMAAPPESQVFGPLKFGPLKQLFRRQLSEWVRGDLKDLLSPLGFFDEQGMITHINDKLPQQFHMNRCVLLFVEPWDKVMGHA